MTEIGERELEVDLDGMAFSRQEPRSTRPLSIARGCDDCGGRPQHPLKFRDRPRLRAS